MSEIARAYDRWSLSYDEDTNATRDLDAHVLRNAGLPVHGAHVVELGAGTGKNTRWLARHAASVLALDFSSGMLTRARSALAEERPAAAVRFVACDITGPWPAADASVDIVVGNLVLEHIDDLAPVFASAARVLRGGGTLFLCELHPYRQLRGGQAHFVDAETGDTTQVTAYTHSVSEYVNGGVAAGLTLEELGEWHDEHASAGTAPRLVSVRFRRLGS